MSVGLVDDLLADLMAVELDPSTDDNQLKSVQELELETESPAEKRYRERWYFCKMLPAQKAFYYSTKRFNCVAAGRRSLKTEAAKRRSIRKALAYRGNKRTRVIAAAPTREQAKRIFWDDFKLMVPPMFMKGKPKETELSIPLVNNVDLCVVGLDNPQRVEGEPLLHIHVDEVADVKPEAWNENIVPALMDMQGTGDLTGVPNGRNHFYTWCMAAESNPKWQDEWDFFTWTAEDALPLYMGEEQAAKEIANMRAILDDMTYDQEMRATFVTFKGRVYYNFVDDEHVDNEVLYHPKLPLLLCFDFNVEPGVLAIAQRHNDDLHFIGEIYIGENSNTGKICKAFLELYGDHPGEVLAHGDATGGARKTSALDGSDWELITKFLTPRFGSRYQRKGKKSNPAERVRVNAVNARFKTVDGKKHIRIHPNCRRLIADFDGVQCDKTGTGAIDKKVNPDLSHISDAAGYLVSDLWPLKDITTIVKN